MKRTACLLYILMTYLLLSPFYASAMEEGRLVVSQAEKEVTLMGYTRTIKSQTVSPEVAGKIVKINYDTGDAIADKPFMEIDPTFTDYEIERTLQPRQHDPLRIPQRRRQLP